ncbi:type II secretion system F family protein [Saccharopolyspora sp. 6V]|uniref:type II secretion system F family protein n=1 Tax=Saccharopolyspora sp. 6V TaxID=2877239 RepID=UPI001CD7B799|nr:pilus assembly protein TadB [Saccharopolyspora sp. 6V]MCA1192881.1 pilus assembly protein TadB [Saccharopolyspora sp. 6V]
MNGIVLTGAACGLAAALAILIVLYGRSGTPIRHRPSPGWWSARWLRLALVAVGLGSGAWWVTGWPVGGIAVAAGVLGLPHLLSPSHTRHGIERAEALVTWTRRVADLLASGAGGLAQAITRSATTAPEPLVEPVGRLAQRSRTHGMEAALRAFADELADPAADAIVLALLLRLRTGGRGLAELLHCQADAQAREIAARRDVEADRAKPRTTVRSLIGITLTTLAGLLIFAGPYLAPFSTGTGQLVLAGIAVFGAGALVWMHRLTTPPPPRRYLTTGEAR